MHAGRRGGTGGQLEVHVGRRGSGDGGQLEVHVGRPGEAVSLKPRRAARAE